jgi:hypothetical protein
MSCDPWSYQWKVYKARLDLYNASLPRGLRMFRRSSSTALAPDMNSEGAILRRQLQGIDACLRDHEIRLRALEEGPVIETTPPPSYIYHMTTPAKAKRYRESGRIVAPVRGFDTMNAALAWGLNKHRTVVLGVRAPSGAAVHKLPDHHNKFGDAWWIDADVVDWECLYSAGEPLQPEGEDER